MIRSRFQKLVTLALPATLAALLLGALVIEAWVRLAWDESRGTPGFFLSDPVLGQRLAANYAGWFAGVPARTNSLGFRDPRDYALAKAPGTLRILVLGDSVTFGHGAIYETTYPYLLEQRLKEWRPDVAWEVWNLGVPGYNTSQELAYLEAVGERYAPDLVVVGFFPNDFSGYEPDQSPGAVRRMLSGVLRTMQRYVYSIELYKRVYLTARWRLFSSSADRQRLEHLESEDALLSRHDAAQADEQKLTELERFSDEDVQSFACEGIGPAGEPALANDLRQQAAHLGNWFAAVARFQALHTAGKYRIVFFAQMAPHECAAADRFIDHGSFADNDALMNVLGRGTPAVSTLPELMHYRPSQLPGASSHSLGNANRVKADVLFAYLRDQLAPALPPPAPANRD